MTPCPGGEEGPDLPDVGASVTYLESIRSCMRHHMRRNPRVVLIGEDIGIMGGAFRVTEHFLAEFGEHRVIDTPISEGAVVGAAIGLALRGAIPVAEMQFADFLAGGWNQLANNAATFHYRSSQAVPMVLRLPSAGGLAAGPFHSLAPEAWLAHFPGLKIVIPSTVEDAWGLMATAMADANPVMFCEQKVLYRSVKGRLPPRDHRTPLGVARAVRAGRDLTVVTWGCMVGIAEAAAEQLADEGYELDILDLRSIVPWDREAVLASVRKTSRALVLHEARLRCGFGAEVAACIADEGFQWLDAPVRRLGALDVPCPSHPKLEAHYRPGLDDVLEAARDVLAF